MRGDGSQRLMSRRMRTQATKPVWLRRSSARRQSHATWEQNVNSADQFVGTP
jgi:hypothetical protein